MNPYLIAITQDIHTALRHAQHAYRRAVWSRGYDRVIHKQSARYWAEKARALRLRREITMAMAESLRVAA